MDTVAESNLPKPSEHERRYIRVLIFATFIAGLCSIIYELLIATTGAYFIGDSIRQFSLVIGFYMAAMGIGSFLSRLIPDENLLHTFIFIEILLGLIGGLSVPLLYFSFAFLDIFQLSVLALTSLIGLLIGMEIPFLSRLMSKHYSLKDNISNILSVDYFGALIATLLFPFLLLPFLGVFRSSLTFGLINMSIGFAVLYIFSDALKVHRKKILLTYNILAFSILLLTIIYAKTIMSSWTTHMYEDRVAYAHETPYQQIVVTKRRDDLRLFLNGNLQFSSVDEHRYHEALIHIPMSGCRCEHVLMLGGGDGLGARELLKYPHLKSITLVDLDPAITTLGKENPLIVTQNKASLLDPRVSIVNEDAFVFANKLDKKFDLIIVDLPDPNNTALARLYSREFYWLLQSALANKGRFVTQATSPYFAREAFWSIEKTLLSSGFENVLPYHVSVPSFGEWGFLMASQSPIVLDGIPEDISTRFLTDELIPLAQVFPKDIGRLSVKENTLDSPEILQYYLSGWKHWR
ncbi:MAG: spermidine synthase [Oceanospirillaceae bacterium]|nr:spermidine synthase [Oceanospirillaceae bacterium]